jgi:Alw26I/Eco31I/Esp3I family type II restriction m6 adenine DNA methyltransferase
VNNNGTWLSSLIRTERAPSRSELSKLASQLRKDLVKNINGARPNLDPRLPTTSDEMVDRLALFKPRASLQRSFAITEAVLETEAYQNMAPAEKGALVCALGEREMWEIPQGDQLKINVALSRAVGSYFTPPSVARYIAARTMGPVLEPLLESGNNLEQARGLRVVDPACGTGMFLLTAFDIFMAFWDAATVRHGDRATAALGSRLDFARHVIERQIVGVDLSPRAIALARHSLRTIAGSPDVNPDLAIGNALAWDPTEDGGCWTSNVPPGSTDVVLLNPPYGRLRALRSDLDEQVRALRLSPREKEDLYQREKDRIDRQKAHFRSDSRYYAATSGVLDWPRIFLVRALGLLKRGGRFGAIVPASITADRTAGRFRQMLLSEHSLEIVAKVPESAGLFPTVNQATAILIAEAGRPTTTIRWISDARNPRDGGFAFDKSEVEKLDPVHLAIPDVRGSDWAVLKELENLPQLRQLESVTNARGELDLTLHRPFIGTGASHLVRGDQIGRFRTGGGDKLDTVDADLFLKEIQNSPKSKHAKQARLVCRQCSYMEQPRRLMFARVPANVIVANSCNYLSVSAEPTEDWLDFLLGILNSAVSEWRFRLTSSNNHVNNYELDALPIPNHVSDRVIRAARALRADPENPRLESTLDAAVATAMGLSGEAVETIMKAIDPRRIDEVLEFVGYGT